MTDLYRENVAIVVFNKNKKVLMCERCDKPGQWQFPQGGVDEGETFSIAAKRELYEETSIVNAKLLYVSEECFYYDFPQERQTETRKGQKQHWSLFYFNGDDCEINLNTKHPEFKSFKWIDINQAPLKIVEFKKDVYIKATALLEPMINAYKV